MIIKMIKKYFWKVIVSIIGVVFLLYHENIYVRLLNGSENKENKSLFN
jgi:hypothetical protein